MDAMQIGGVSETQLLDMDTLSMETVTLQAAGAATQPEKETWANTRRPGKTYIISIPMYTSVSRKT
jgi:hypothetical protein